MPWKVSNPVSLRMKFICRLEEGEKMTDLCREFEISRKTGYKIYNRYLDEGAKGLEDASRRPVRLANLMDSGLARVLLTFKKDKPTWGAPKLRELLIRKHPGVKPPAISTVHALLERNGLVKHQKRRHGFKATGTSLSVPVRPNDLWCTDFKGQFHLGDGSLCYPLTITDQVSRMIQAIDAMERICELDVIDSFRRVFCEYGLPYAIRSDNGMPFASRGVFGLSKLSVFWLRLGIKLERIKPGNPQQNGQHERMHKTLKLWTSPSKNILSQQEKFDLFRGEFNNERPHEALKMRTPGEVYQPSSRTYSEVLPEIKYVESDIVIKVMPSGLFRLPKNEKRIFVGSALAGQYLGASRVDDKLWRLSFMEHELGFFDEESYKFSPGRNPFSLSNENK